MAKVDSGSFMSYPNANLSPAAFEGHVVDLLSLLEPSVDDFVVELHEVMHTPDGSYDLDGTVRFTTMGMDFLVIVEVKHHAHPIKRELVQVLNQKVMSAKAQKGLMVSASRYQSGAMKFADVHGIALVHATTSEADWVTRTDSNRPSEPEVILQSVRLIEDSPKFAVVTEHPGNMRRLLLDD